MAVVAPIPKATVIKAVVVNPGAFRSCRSASRRSASILSSRCSYFGQHFLNLVSLLLRRRMRLQIMAMLLPMIRSTSKTSVNRICESSFVPGFREAAAEQFPHPRRNRLNGERNSNVGSGSGWCHE
jgi:hypothetical protein